jgi:hypothetical protein
MRALTIIHVFSDTAVRFKHNGMSQNDLISKGTLQERCQWDLIAHIGQGSQNLPTSYKSTVRAVSEATRDRLFRGSSGLSGKTILASDGGNVSSVKHRKSPLANRFTRTGSLNLAHS